MDELEAWVLIGALVEARRDRAEATVWLRSLVTELDEAYGGLKLAPFGVSQGDEVQGLLVATADPLLAVLRAALRCEPRPIRWVCIQGAVDPGEGSATQRTGSAFLAARAAIEAARAGHERLVIRTGRADADELLDGMTPAMADLLYALTPRQQAVARLALIEGLRQSEVAERLKVRRATISVSFARARVMPLARLAAAMRKAYAGASTDATPAAASPQSGTDVYGQRQTFR
jgi:DNA-binding CsgD family transcriptional regulator